MIRTLHEVGIFSDEGTETALKMADDRNLTALTYDEKMAVALAERIIVYERLLAEWFRRMKS